MALPLLLSVPHAGLRVPAEAEPYCVLTGEEIVADGDVGAAEIYDLESEAAGFVTSDVARAIIDLNRSENDRSKDGVVKTHTCWDVPVYSSFPPEDVVASLLAEHYHPYHERLTSLGGSGRFRLGVDCHTMAALGPPVGPDPGSERPWACLSNADGTCPQSWVEGLRDALERSLGGTVTVNTPFRGGYITRTHAAEMPWVQLELSRAQFMTDREKRERVLAALGEWCHEGGGL